MSTPLLRRRGASIALSAVVLAGGAITLSACNPLPPCSRNWTGATNSNFSVASNWAENLVPGPADRACSTGGSTIVIDTNETVESMYFDGTVTIPIGVTLTNISALDTPSLIDNAIVQGTVGGTSPMIFRGTTMTGHLAGNDIVVMTGNHPLNINNMTVDDDKAVLTIGNPTLNGAVHLCANGALGFLGDTTISSNQTFDSVGCATVTNPAFGVGQSGTLHLNADISAAGIGYGSLGTVNIGAGHTLTTKTNSQLGGVTTLGTGSVVTPLTGGYVLTAGTLTGTGTVTSDVTGAGILAPGTNHAGILNVQGRYLPSAGAKLQYDVASATPGTGFGQLTATSATLTGATLAVTADVGFAPVTGDSLALVQAAGVTGPFTATALPTVAGHGLAATLALTEVDLVVTDCDPGVYHPGVILTGQNLSGKNLIGCDLSGATLFTTNLSGANLTGANLTGAHMGFANLTNATVTGANFTNAINLNNALGLLSTLNNGWSNTNFSGTALNLASQNLSVHGTQLNGANLSGANLSGATMSLTNLSGTILNGTNLTGANVTSASIDATNFTNAVLTNATLNGSVGVPAVTLPATYSNTICPSSVNSDANGGNCEGTFSAGGGGGHVGSAAVLPNKKR